RDPRDLRSAPTRRSSDLGSQLTPVTLDAATRPGIFTRLGFLASHASFNRTSPILRGAFLQKEILCKEIPPPPPDVEGTPLPSGEDRKSTRLNSSHVKISY